MTHGRVVMLLALLACSELDAQVLEGRVMEEGRILSISDADVVLLDRDGDPRARATADAFGRFLLEPPEAGEFYVRAELDAIAVLRPVEAATFFGTQAGNGVILMWTRRGGR